MDTISSSLVDEFYKDDQELKKKRRITAIVGASYLLHLRASRPEALSPAEVKLLEQLLAELEVPAQLALELLKEMEEKGPSAVMKVLART